MHEATAQNRSVAAQLPHLPPVHTQQGTQRPPAMLGTGQDATAAPHAQQLAYRPAYHTPQSGNGAYDSPIPSRSSLSQMSVHSVVSTSSSRLADYDAHMLEGLPCITLPMLDTTHYEDVVHNVVWHVARDFGFQAFNVQPDTAGYDERNLVPATAFVASDHLVNIIVRNMMLRASAVDKAVAAAAQLAAASAKKGKKGDPDATSHAAATAAAGQGAAKVPVDLDRRFAQCVLEMHSTIFHSYEEMWCRKLKLSPRPDKYTEVLAREYCDPAVTLGLLAELALYFLMYSEAINLRHMPESLWFFYWLAAHAPEMQRFWGFRTGPAAPALDLLCPPAQGAQRRAALRNALQAPIAQAQASLGHHPAACRPAACARALARLPSLLAQAASDLGLASSPSGPGSCGDAELFFELVAFGDGGFVTDRVVTPVFYVLAYEMDAMFTAGQEEAFRLGYDDVNESLCCRSLIMAALADLGVSKAQVKAGAVNAGWASLTRLGCTDPACAAAYHAPSASFPAAGTGLLASASAAEEAWVQALEDCNAVNDVDATGALGPSAFDGQAAACWWSDRVFVKTYKERRTFLAVFRGFYRVFSLHFTMMHVIAAYAWAPGDLTALSSAVITHAIFSALERYANWYMTRSRPDPLHRFVDTQGWMNACPSPAQAAEDKKKSKGRKAKASDPVPEDGGEAGAAASQAAAQAAAAFGGLADREAALKRHRRRQDFSEDGAPLWGVFGFVEWLLVAVGIAAFFVCQYIGPMMQMAQDYWLFAAGGYTAVMLAHGILTTRDGYTVSFTHALRLPAFFRASSCRPAATYWMAKDMSIGWRDWTLTVLFWVQTLTLKVVFDYFVILKPMRGPIQLILKRNWLACGTPNYTIMGTELPIPCVDGDWVLVVMRVVPFILIMLVDTQIFYQMTTITWGIIRGLCTLDLGVVQDWSSLRAEFHRGPMRWWEKGVSLTGASNRRAAIALRRAGLTVGASVGVSASVHSGSSCGSNDAFASPASLQLLGGAGPAGSLVSGAPGAGSGASAVAQALAGLYPRLEVTATAVAADDAGGDDDASAKLRKAAAKKRAQADAKAAKKDKTAASPADLKSARGGKQGMADMRLMLSATDDESLAMWDAFASAWDEIVADLRSGDLVSDREAEHLLFTRLSPAAAGLRQTGVRPLLLPAFFYAGQAQLVVDSGVASAAQRLVLVELRGLAAWLGCTLGLVGPRAGQVLLQSAWAEEVVDLAHSQARALGMSALAALLAALQEVQVRVQGPADEARRAQAHKDVFSALQGLLACLETEARAVLHVSRKAGGKRAARKQAAEDKGGVESAGVAAWEAVKGDPSFPLPPPCDEVEASHRLLALVAQLRDQFVAAGPGALFDKLSALHSAAEGQLTLSAGACIAGILPAAPKMSSHTSYSSLGPSASELDLTQRASPARSSGGSSAGGSGCSGVAGSGLDMVNKVLRVAQRMLTLSSAATQPAGKEAQRLLTFFMTSLANGEMEKPPSVDEMLSWTVVTPVYEEDVLYPLCARATAQQLGLPTANASKALVDLLSEGEDDVSLMAYLRSMFPKDWENFKERLGQSLGRDLRNVTEMDFAPGGALHAHCLQLQLWASYRGQLLARTVRGMMCYERAVRVLVQLEYPRPPGLAPASYDAWVDKIVDAKFSYVASVQVYGRCRTSRELRPRWLAESVDVLLETFPKLKAAYLDAAPSPQGPANFSVLIRGANRPPAKASAAAAASSSEASAAWRATQRVEELYRVRLPANRHSGRGAIIGEGKPENQNHATIFAFGEALQTIDMNQDNALAEALKMRNLLSELKPDTQLSRASRRAAVSLAATAALAGGDAAAVPGAEFRSKLAAAKASEKPTAIVGFREWIFSDVSGALGSFAACAEYTFGTMVQRTMASPAHVRLHYGHPDIFNKLFTMTRGGVSKATRQLHISEDVFGGINHSLRGASIKYKEYISVGKGRDMGFDSINAFEVKISGGCAEIFLSRDMYRMATRLDIFRLLHLYFSLAGHYVNNWLVMASVYAQILSLCIFALARASSMVVPELYSVASNDEQPALIQRYIMQDTIRIENVLQLGMLSLIPFVAELALEFGFVKALLVMLSHLATGSFAFFVFKQQTTGAYFVDSLMYGGAQYIGTGRGFSISSSSFVKLFSNYGRTHIYFGFELAFLAIVFAIVNDCSSCSYGGLTWGTWLAAASLLFGPFWFNPLTFSTSKVKRDLRAFARWLGGEVDPETKLTWHAWNSKQLARVRNDRGNQTDHWMNVFWGLLTQVSPLFLLALATVSRLDLQVNVAPKPFDSPYIVFIVATLLLWGAAYVGISVGGRYKRQADRRGWRLFAFWAMLAGTGLFVAYMAVLSRFYSGSGIINLLLILYANLNLLLAAHRAAVHLATRSPRARAAVDAGFMVLDLLVGYILLGVIGLLSLIGIIARIQTTLLFNVTFARSVRRGSIVRTIGGKKADGASSQLAGLLNDDVSSVSSSPSTPTLNANGGAGPRLASTASPVRGQAGAAAGRGVSRRTTAPALSLV